MAMSRSAKEETIDRLSEAQRKGHKLEVVLRFQGEAGEADRVKTSTDELKDEIDRLLSEIMAEWVGSSRTVIADLKGLNRKLQAEIRDIKKKIRVAEKVVKAIGLIDDAVELAGGLV